MAVREIAVPWDIQPPPGTQVNWNNDLASQADYIVSPLIGELSAKAGASDRFVSLSSGLLVPRSLGTSFGANGGTSDGHSTASNFTAISGATSLSLFVVLQCTTTTGTILARWGTAANFGGLLVGFDANALTTVIAPGVGSATWYAKRTGALSAGTILYGCTWYGANSQDNYINGVVNNGTTWFTGSPAAIQTASEKLYLNRNADAASGSGNSSVLFAAIGINKKWTASTHAQWAASYNEVYEPRRIWVPVSLASSNVTITGTPGNAVADGVAARVNQARAVTGTAGNAAAAGVTAKINQARTVTGAVGNAVAAGVAASVNRATSIAATPGNAAATGVPATITAAGAVVITGTPGNAAAAGVSASINQARSVTGTAGNAVAAGVQATISTAGAGVTITATPGNAFASGPQAIIVRNVAIAAAVGNAVAAGRQATVSNITATDDLYPLEGMSQDYPLQGMTQTYPLAGQTPS